MKSAPTAPTQSQTEFFTEWRRMMSRQGFDEVWGVTAAFLAAEKAGEALAEIENATPSSDPTPSPDIGFDP
jgi:hypothetical protein